MLDVAILLNLYIAVQMQVQSHIFNTFSWRLGHFGHHKALFKKKKFIEIYGWAQK